MNIAELKTSTLLNQTDEDSKICTECGADMEEGACPECNDLDEELEEGELEGLSDKNKDEDWIQ